jgi:hypothetical protein
MRYVLGAFVIFVAMSACSDDDGGQPPGPVGTDDAGNGGVDSGGSDSGQGGSSDASADAATDAPAVARQIGGTVVGLHAGNVVLQNNGGDDLTITKDGTFVFAKALAPNATYDVQVKTQPPGDFCSVVNGKGTVSTTDVGNVVVHCGVELACPVASSGTTQTVCGRLYDLEDNSLFLTDTHCTPCGAATATGPCALKITAYDGFAYAVDPGGTAALAAAESYIDTCGRYRLKDVALPSSSVTMLVVDDASVAAAGPTGVTVPVAIAFSKVPGAAIRDVELWMVAQTTTQGWEANGGPTLAGGIFAPIFRANVNRPGVDLFANQSGVTVTKSGSANASADHYFAAGATARTTLDPSATATGANGTALVTGASVADGLVYSGQGGLTDSTTCRWETKAGLSLPSVVFVQLYRPTNAAGMTCSL